MRKMFITPVLLALIVASQVAVHVEPAYASPTCRGCDIVGEGLFDQNLPGYYVYFDLGNQYVKVTILDVDIPNSTVRWRTDDGQSGWDHASHFYSEESLNEIKLDTMSVGYVGACGIYAAARGQQTDFAGALMIAAIRNACCDPTAAAQYGTGTPPPELCR